MNNATDKMMQACGGAGFKRDLGIYINRIDIECRETKTKVIMIKIALIESNNLLNQKILQVVLEN